MIMRVIMDVVVAVIVVRVAVRSFPVPYPLTPIPMSRQNDFKVRPVDAAAQDGFRLQFVAVERQLGQFAAQTFEVKTQVEQCTDQHVSGNARKRIEVQNPTARRCGHVGLQVSALEDAGSLTGDARRD
jgi:hypothetical protein